MVPSSLRPAGSAIVGQPAAGSTKSGSAGGGGGGGLLLTGGGLLIVTLPLLPAEEISSAPQPAKLIAMLATIRWDALIFIEGSPDIDLIVAVGLARGGDGWQRQTMKRTGRTREPAA